MEKKPSERSVEELLRNGFINLDKPPGPTSHEVTAWVKKILNVKKVGHGGTLDPGATGLLPIAIGKGVKALRTFLTAEKEYIAVMVLHEYRDPDTVRNVCKEFVGDIYQRPPVRSSVKRNVRIRRVYKFECLDFMEKNVIVDIACSAGTYIRKLIHDVGEVLRCGAHMKELRRIRLGNLTERDSVTLHDLLDGYIFWKEDGDERLIRKAIWPIEDAITHVPKVIIRDSAVDAICHGAALAVPGIVSLDEFKIGDLVAIMTLKGELVALGEALMDTQMILKRNSGLAIKTDTVFMEPGTYPRGWKTE